MQSQVVGEPRGQFVRQLGKGRLEVLKPEDGALEERAAGRIIGVLVERDDVRPVALRMPATEATIPVAWSRSVGTEAGRRRSSRVRDMVRPISAGTR
jgi:hypothetical protein